MDKDRRTLLIVLVCLIALVSVAAIVWFAGISPYIKRSKTESRSARERLDKAVRSADTAVSQGKEAVARWEGLGLSGADEMQRVRQDIEARRSYDAENRRDPGARSVAGDIDKVIATATKSENQLRAALKDSESSNKKKRAEKSLARLIRLRTGMEQLKSDIDVFGFYALSLSAANQLYHTLVDASGFVSIGRYEEGSQTLQTASSYENEVALWHDYGNQELTNLGKYSKDAESILEFMSRSRTVISMLGQIKNAGLQGDQAGVETGKIKLDRDLKDLDRIVKDYGIDGAFKTWFLKSAHRYVDDL